MSTYDKVKELCEKNGTTIKSLEKEIGLGNGTISYWKKGSPKAELISRVANYFNVSVDSLLENDNGAFVSYKVDVPFKFSHNENKKEIIKLLRIVEGLPKSDIQLLTEIAKKLK